MTRLILRGRLVRGAPGLGLFTGTYTGDGNATQAVTGVGCRPFMVWIIPNVSDILGLGMKCDRDGLNSIDFDAAPGAETFRYAADNIISLDADGFTVGDGSALGVNLENVNAQVYTYACWGAGPGLSMAAGAYVGDGNATKVVTGVDFRPRLVFIHTPDDLGGATGYAPNGIKTDRDGLLAAAWRPGWVGWMWNPDHIISLDADGFTVGDGSSDLNLLNVDTINYIYTCFR